MKNIPTIFGYPLWEGKIKRRIAKKYLNSWSFGKHVKYWTETFATYGVGSIINDCSGYNGKIVDMWPNYRPLLGKGWILVGVDFTTTNTGCSLLHCGIEKALTREQIETSQLQSLTDWLVNGGADQWYGDTKDPVLLNQLKVANDKFVALKNGQHIVDELGMLLPEFKG